LNEAEYCYKEALKHATNPSLDYAHIGIIKKFFGSFTMPTIKLNPKTDEYEKYEDMAMPGQEVRISIQKLNVRGLEKFIKDLNDQITKICPYTDKLDKDLDQKQIEFVKDEIVKDLKDFKLIIEFSNSEGEDIENYINTKVNYNIDKIYEAEYEKELKDLATACEQLKKNSKKQCSGVKNRSAKRRSNMRKSDFSGTPWETDVLPTQKLDEVRNVYNTKFRKYIDRIKSDIVGNNYEDTFTEEQIESVFLFNNYLTLADTDPKQEKSEDEGDPDEEEKDEEMGLTRKISNS